MDNYIPLFKNMVSGQPIYSLIKSDPINYYEGKIVSIGNPRLEMAKNLNMPNNVIDVTYEINGTNYTDTVNIADSMFSTEKTGAITLVATSKDIILRELRASLKSDEEFLNTIDETKDRKIRNVEQYKNLIATLDTEWAKQQALENRITSLENNSKETNTLLKTILKKVESL